MIKALTQTVLGGLILTQGISPSFAVCCPVREQIPTLLELGRLYYEEQNPSQAIDNLQQAEMLLNQRPLNPYQKGWEQLAYYYRQLDQAERSLAIYTRLYQELPAYQERYALRAGQTALQLKNQPLARTWLKRANIRPEESLWIELAAALRDANLPLLARQRYRAIRDNNIPFTHTMRLYYADTLLPGYPTQAREVLQDYASETPDQWPLEASVRLQLGDLARASVLYERLRQRFPDNVDYALALGSVRLRQQAPARESFLQAYTLWQKSPAALTPSQRSTLLFGLSESELFAEAEAFFRALDAATNQDLLVAAQLAQRRQNPTLAAARYRRLSTRLQRTPDSALESALLENTVALVRGYPDYLPLLTELAEISKSTANNTPSRLSIRVLLAEVDLIQAQRQLLLSQTPEDYARWQGEIVRQLTSMEELSPSPETRILIAEGWLNLGLKESSEKALELLETVPMSPRAQLRQAQAHLQAQQPLAASTLYQALYTNSDRGQQLSSTQRLNLARNLSALGQTRRAEQLFDLLDGLSETEQNSTQLRLLQLKNRWRQHPRKSPRFKNVLQRIKMPEKATFRDVDTHLEYAHLALELGASKQAFESYTKVLDLHPGERSARRGRALSLQDLQRHARAYTALENLQEWYPTTHENYREASLRLAQIEQHWQHRHSANARTTALLHQKDTVFYRAQRLREDLYEARWDLTPDHPLEWGYDSRNNVQAQDLFIGGAYTRYGTAETAHTLRWQQQNPLEVNDPQPDIQHAITLDTERYQELGAPAWFDFQRGSVGWESHWRYESPTGPVSYTLNPRLSYHRAWADRQDVGSVQYGNASLNLGLQWNTHQAFAWENDLRFGEADLFLGSFYNYGSRGIWRWRQSLPGATPQGGGTWGWDITAGLENYLILDGNGEEQSIFRQLNQVGWVYETRHVRYRGDVDISPILGDLNDLNFNTSHTLRHHLSPRWSLWHRLEAHHYFEPVQRFQNRVSWQSRVSYEIPTPQRFPLYAELGTGLNLFYSTQVTNIPLFYLGLRTRL